MKRKDIKKIIYLLPTIFLGSAVIVVSTNCNSNSESKPIEEKIFCITNDNILKGFQYHFLKLNLEGQKRLILQCSGNENVLKIPDNVESVADMAFIDGSTGKTTIPLFIEKVIFNNNLTEIGSMAFSSSKGLTSLNFSNCSDLHKIGTSAFCNCQKLTEVNLSNCTNLREINDFSFASCSRLSSVNFPKSITTIGDSAFSDSHLGILNLVNCVNLSSIGDNAFENCGVLKEVSLRNCNNLTTIGNYAFRNCSWLSSVILSKCSSLRLIGSYAFYDCFSLSSVVLSDCTNLNKINDYAFWMCCDASHSFSIDFSNCHNLNTIGKWSFAYCRISSVQFYHNLTSIGEHAFYSSSLNQITWNSPKKPITIGEGAFLCQSSGMINSIGGDYTSEELKDLLQLPDSWKAVDNKC